MTYRTDDGTGPELPPELAELDAELASIEIDERPSFAPELKAELERAWARPPRRKSIRMGPAMAAAFATLMFGGLLVPQARASLARLLPWQPVAVPDERQVPQSVSVPATGPLLPGITPVVVPNRSRPVDVVPLAFPIPGVGVEVPFELVENAFPEFIDREAAVRTIREHYPVTLQEQGIGGLVTVRVWVAAEGVADDVQIVRSAGVPELDRVALTVIPSLGFRPARRFGVPVGTWVQFDLSFEPSPGYRQGVAVDGFSLVDGPLLGGGLRTRIPADLLLVRPANPAPSEVRRTASWAVPLSGDPVDATMIGAIFELLDLPDDRVGYELQAHVQDSDGWITPLMIRPAGAEEFRASWSRLGGETRRVSEYVTVDLNGLSAGEYVLWLTATLSESGERGESGRMLTVR